MLLLLLLLFVSKKSLKSRFQSELLMVPFGLDQETMNCRLWYSDVYNQHVEKKRFHKLNWELFSHLLYMAKLSGKILMKIIFGIWSVTRMV